MRAWNIATRDAKRKRTRICAGRGVEGDKIRFPSRKKKKRDVLSPSLSLSILFCAPKHQHTARTRTTTTTTTHSKKKKKKYQMGKTGTEKPLKAPKKKHKELDEDDLAALARKKEEQAKLNALKKQVAGGAKLGKGMSKSK